jgi:5-enolpyruvylshikimate-3-phosphate synthase
MDSAEEDFKISGVNNWKTKEANRMEWIGVVGAVKARTRS